MIFLFAILFLVFCLKATIAPSFFDSGEFVAVIESLGNSHPTGHPTYPLFLKPFSWLPLGTKAFRAGLGSCFYLALFVSIFYKMSRSTLERLMDRKRFVAIFSALLPLVIAFHPSTVLQWARPEVYPLFYALLFGALYFLSPSKTSPLRHRYLGMFFLALSIVTQPLLGGLVFLALFLFQILSSEKWQSEWLFFFLGFAVFLFLPLRATQAPVINWGNPDDASSLLKVLLAKDFRIFFHAPTTSDSLRDLLGGSLFQIFSPWAFVFGFFWILWAFRSQERKLVHFSLWIALGLFLPFVVKDFYTANPDSHAYIIPFLAWFLLFSTSSLVVLRNWTWVRGTWLFLVWIPALLFVHPFEAYSVATQEPGQRSDILARHIHYLKPGADLLMYSDHWVFPMWNAQYVEGRRPDVSVASLGMLRASWYRDQLSNLYGNLKRRPRAHETQKIETRSKFTGYLLTDSNRGDALKSLFRKSCLHVTGYDPFQTQKAICAHVETVPLSYLRGERRFDEALREASSALGFENGFSGDCSPSKEAFTLPYPLSLELRDRYFIAQPNQVANILASLLFLCQDWPALKAQTIRDSAAVDAKLLWAWHLFQKDLPEKALDVLEPSKTSNRLDAALTNVAAATIHILQNVPASARKRLHLAKSVLGEHPAIRRLEEALEKMEPSDA